MKNYIIFIIAVEDLPAEEATKIAMKSTYWSKLEENDFDVVTEAINKITDK
jgi:hypothetical protein